MFHFMGLFFLSSWFLLKVYDLIFLQTEVKYLGQLRHPNLVKLVGYCSEGDSRLLVYEFMPKGSLENHLFRRMFYQFWSTFAILFALSGLKFNLTFFEIYRRPSTTSMGNKAQSGNRSCKRPRFSSWCWRTSYISWFQGF